LLSKVRSWSSWWFHSTYE